jgi:ParB family chromosome partitioning protein
MYLARLATTEIRPPAHAVRAEIDERLLAELVEDVKRNGVLVPPHVRPVPGGYEIVAGHRRYLAACAAGLESLSCLVAEPADAHADVTKLSENLYRQELSPVEEGAYFAELFEALGHDTDKVAARVGKRREYVESRLLLLQGDPEVLSALARKAVTLAVATELNKMSSPDDRAYYLAWAVTQGATAKLVRFWREGANARRAVEPPESPPGGEAALAPNGPEDIFRCYLCGEVEPRYDLAVVHVHRACRTIVERQAERAEVKG